MTGFEIHTYFLQILGLGFALFHILSMKLGFINNFNTSRLQIPTNQDRSTLILILHVSVIEERQEK
jgi:hypothetical protein